MFTTLEDETARPLQVERPDTSPADVAELEDERIVLRGEESSGVEPSLKKGPFFVYGGGEVQVPKGKEVGSKKRKLSSLMVSTGI